MVKLTSKAKKLTLFGGWVIVLLVAWMIARDVAPAAWGIPGSPQKTVNTGWFGVAIKGHDTVAYFTEGRAIKGKAEFELTWEDARWRFANAANLDLFKNNPDKYAPKYGGF